MKTKLFTLLLALVASVGSIFASVVIDGIAYILNETEYTAEVTDGGNYSGDIVIPPSVEYESVSYAVTTIARLAFFLSSDLTSVSFSNVVTSIGEKAFLGCDNLVAINVDSENPNYCDIDGVLFNKNQTELVRYPNGKAKFAPNYVIPNSVTCIGNFAFTDCVNMTSVTIPSNVTSIGEFAFQIIESSLSHIVCKAVIPPTLSNCVFDGIDSSVSLYVPDESMNAYKAADQWKEFKIRPISTLPQGVENIHSCKAQSAKTLRNGQILILRAGRTYTLTGQEVQ